MPVLGEGGNGDVSDGVGIGDRLRHVARTDLKRHHAVQVVLAKCKSSLNLAENRLTAGWSLRTGVSPRSATAIGSAGDEVFDGYGLLSGTDVVRLADGELSTA